MDKDAIIIYMLKSKNIEDWNARRETVKQHRNKYWIAKFIDASALIKKTKFVLNRRQNKQNNEKKN